MILMAIKTFARAEVGALFAGKPWRRLPVDIQRTALRKLLQLHAASELAFLRIPPGNRLEALQGDRWGQYSIRVNAQWRICFTWQDGHAYQVDIVDYH